METKINLNRLEKDTLSAVFRTGLVDIEVGLIFIVVSLAMIFDDISYYIDIGFIVPIVFILVATRYIINPRMGVVKFTMRRLKKRMMMWITITIFLVVMVTLQVIGVSFSENGAVNPRILISAIILIICLAVAYFMEYYRMYLYAFLFTGTFNLSEEIRENAWFGSEGGYAYLLTAVILVVTGSIFLAIFLKTHPLPGSNDYYEG